MSGPTHAPSEYRPRDVVPIRRALISVSDKTGVLELAAALANAGVEIVSTGGSAKAIADAGHPVIDVTSVTGFPESLDGRVKTLHPAVHGGLLADLRLASHEEQLAELGIKPFELVVVNLYPFEATVAAGASFDDTVEQIDIGGPAMVRASAKNHANVAIVVSPDSYPEIIEAVASGGTTLAQRRELAALAFGRTASYDAAIVRWMDAQSAPLHAPDDAPSADVDSLPGWINLNISKSETLRYGENSHQQAGLYPLPDGHGIAQAEQLHGKEMSYNNYVDADAALRAAYDFAGPTIAIIKHANPCGIATNPVLAEAHRLANECDATSAFGGVIASNRPIDLATAESIRPIFTEVVIAPDFEPDALALLSASKNLRLLRLPAQYSPNAWELRQLSGGFLAQTADHHFAAPEDWTLAAGEPADEATLADLVFAWTACRAVKSNAILLAQDGASVGVGMGQVNRVDSCRLAVERAGDRAAGSVAASDAFFPFADGAQVLLDAGITAIVQPGGSMRDQQTIDAVTAAGVTMYFTGERHFFH